MACHVPINDSCNLRCVFCSAQDRGGDFSLPALLSLIAGSQDKDIVISGGEPLARAPADLLQILLSCRRMGKRVELQTNGTLIESYDLKKMKLIARLVDFFNVNFSAHTPRLDVLVTRVPGAFARRVRGVRRLLEMGASVRLSHIICAANHSHCEDFVRFAQRELAGFSWLQFSYCKVLGRVRRDTRVLPRFQDAAPALRKACRLCEQRGIAFDVDHIPICFIPEYKEHHVDYRKMSAGSSGAHLVEKRQVAQCAACEWRNGCPGPRVDYIEVYGGL